MNFDDQFRDIDVICFDLVCSNRVRFFVIYRPPYYDNSAAQYIRLVIKCVATYESPRCTNIIVGDINLPKINWKTLSCSNDSFNWPFVSFLIESSYNQIIDFPTHDDNILDVVLTTDVNIVDHVRPDVPFGASDHAMVLFSVTFVSDSQYRRLPIAATQRVVWTLRTCASLVLVVPSRSCPTGTMRVYQVDVEGCTLRCTSGVGPWADPISVVHRRLNTADPNPQPEPAFVC